MDDLNFSGDGSSGDILIASGPTTYEDTANTPLLPQYQSDSSVTGNSNTYPSVSVSPQATSDAPISATQNIFGTLNNVLSNAKNLGTAVGTLQSNIKNAGANFSNAQNAAANQNKMGQWWLYSSTQDKLMVGIGAVLVLLAAKQYIK